MDILLKNHNDQQNDWIGIYKAGTSNEWKNVIRLLAKLIFQPSDLYQN